MLKRIKFAKRLSVGLSAFAMAGSALALVGWASGVRRLTDWFDLDISQLPNNAVGVFAGGAATMLLVLGYRRASAMLALFAGLIGGTTLLEHLAGINLGIDALLLTHDWGHSATLAPGRMGVPGSASLLLTGAAILLAIPKRTRGWAAAGGVMVIALAIVSIIGYSFQARLLYTLPHLTTISLQTALLMLALGIALVAAIPDRLPARLLVEDSASALLVLSSLPGIMLVPLLIGWLTLKGERAGVFDTAFATAAMALVVIVLLLALLWRTAHGVMRYERALREQQEWLRVTLASIGEAVIATDTGGHVVFMNPVAEKLTGWTEEDANGRVLDSVFAIVNEQTRQTVENPVAEVLREEAVVGLGSRSVLIAKDGIQRPIDDCAAPIRDALGAMIGVVLTFRDVTEHRLAEQELRSSEYRNRAVLETAIDCIITMDHQGKVLEFNPAAEKTFGYGREQVLGEELAEFIIPPSLRERHRQGMAHYLETGEGPAMGQRLELPALRADGSEFPIELSITRIAMDGPPQFTAYLRDITDRKVLEESLRSSEERLRLALDAGGMGVWDWNVRTGNLKWSDGLEPLHGLAPGTFDGTLEHFQQLIHPEDREAVNVAIGQGLETGGEFYVEFRNIWQNGGVHWIAGSGKVFPGDDGKPLRMIGIGLDVTRRKRAEHTARFLADASTVLAELEDFDSTLQKVSSLAVPAFADWATVDVAEADGSLRRVSVSHVDPARVQLAHELHRRFPPEPGAPQGAWNILRTGQSEIVPEITDELLVQSINDQEQLAIIRQLGLSSYIGVPLTVRGKTLAVISFINAESGHRYDSMDLAVAEDMASRAAIAVENSQLYRELRDADQRKDEFLATLAHELRNPLAPISNGMQVLRMSGGSGQLADDARLMIERQLSQMVRLVDDLLDVSRITRNNLELRKERVSLEAVVSSAAETSRPLMEQDGHTLSITLPPAPVYLDADPTRLAQVFSNLLNNAAKYTEPGGRIAITAKSSGDEVVVEVRDNGMGIPGDALPHIFEMFSQVDRNMERAQGGLGIGLSLVRRLVELHHGTIEARSQGPGQGSQFVARLPIASVIQPAATSPSEHAPPPARRRILVVDDNYDSAKTLSVMLELMGNETHSAHDGLAAVEAAEAFRPDLILLDIGLPKLNGYDACRRIRDQPWSYGMVIVALTGWGQDEDRRRSREAGFDEHLVKPVDLEELTRILAV